jgi:hypothetical protein
MERVMSVENDDKGGNEHPPRHTVTIFVDDEPHHVRPGAWEVSTLKAEVGVDPAKVLSEITPKGLVDLEEDKKIAVHEGQKFMSHARTGGSS